MEKARSIEITAISAEGLRIASRPIKQNAFMIVRTDSQNYRSTSIDRDGGSYPSWNEKFQLALPPNARSIAVEAHCKRINGLIKKVGSVNIPISDIIEDYVPACQIHFLSYRLLERDGEPNGIVNLSIRMVGPEYIQEPTPPLVGEKRSDGIAIGIPVPYGYRS